MRCTSRSPRRRASPPTELCHVSRWAPSQGTAPQVVEADHDGSGGGLQDTWGLLLYQPLVSFPSSFTQRVAAVVRVLRSDRAELRINNKMG